MDVRATVYIDHVQNLKTGKIGHIIMYNTYNACTHYYYTILTSRKLITQFMFCQHTQNHYVPTCSTYDPVPPFHPPLRGGFRGGVVGMGGGQDTCLVKRRLRVHGHPAQGQLDGNQEALRLAESALPPPPRAPRTLTLNDGSALSVSSWRMWSRERRRCFSCKGRPRTPTQ